LTGGAESWKLPGPVRPNPLARVEEMRLVFVGALLERAVR
jgi:hypothetical protein